MIPKLLKALKGHASGVYTAAVDPKRQRIYTGSADGVLGSWNYEQLEPDSFSVRVGEPVFSVFFYPEKDQLLIGQGKGGIHVIDLKAQKELRHLKYHELPVFRIDRNASAGVIYSLGGDGNLSIIRDEDYKLLWSIPLSTNKLRCMHIHQNEKLLIGGSDGYLRVLETEYYNELKSQHIHEGGVYAIMALPDGRLVTGGRDGHLRFWELKNDELIPLDAIPAHNYAIYDLALHPSGKYFASGSRDKTVKIWALDDLRKPIRIQRKGPIGHTHSVNRVGWIPETYRLFSAGDDRDLHIWELSPNP
jgi:WD40 repeat protein